MHFKKKSPLSIRRRIFIRREVESGDRTINYCPVLPKYADLGLANKTGTLNTLYKVSLTEQVNQYQRRYDKNTCGVLYYVLVLSPTCCHLELVYDGLRSALVYIGHQIESVTG